MSQSLQEAIVTCVRKRFRTRKEFCEMTGLGYANVSNWDRLYDEELNFIGPEDLRGRANRLPEAVREHLVAVARKAQESEDSESFNITEFYRSLVDNWPGELGQAPCRETVTEVLIGNGLYQAEPRKERRQEPRPVKGYYPGAQVAVDGHEVPVYFGNERFTFNVEFCRGVETGQITGHAVTDEETGDAVLEVLEQHPEENPAPAKLLRDSRSSNLDHRVQALLEEQGIEHERISDWKSNGGLEGEFGNFSKVVDKELHLEGETRQDLARSALEQITRVYVKLRPAPRRCATDPAAQPKTGEQKAPLDEQMKTADQRRRESRVPERCEEKRNEIEFIVHHLGLEVEDVPRFECNLAEYDLKALRGAREAYVAYSSREAFDRNKAHAYYFLGIAKNKQKEIDQARRAAKAREKHSLDQKRRTERQQLQLELEARRESKLLQRDPIALIIRKLEILQPAPPAIRNTMKSMYQEIRACLKRLTPEGFNNLLGKVSRAFGQAAEDMQALLFSLTPESSV